MSRRSLIIRILAPLAVVLAAGTAFLVLGQKTITRGPGSSAATTPPEYITFQYSIFAPISHRDDDKVLRSYPVVEIKEGRNGLPKDVGVRVTSLLNNQVRSTVSDFEKTGRKSGWDSVFETGGKWRIAIRPDVGIRTDWILTVAFTADETYGGVNTELPSATTIDMHTGNVITLDDLFKGGNSSILQRRVRTGLIAEVAQRQQTSSLPRELLTPPAQLVSPGQVEAVLAEGRWYPDDDGLHVLAQSGLFSTVAAGVITVVIPWNNLSDLTTPFTGSVWKTQ
jgi:hypothetical protein